MPFFVLTYNLHFSWNWEKRWSYGIFIFYIIFFAACLLLLLIIHFAQAILPVRWDKYSKNYDFFLSSFFFVPSTEEAKKNYFYVARRRLELKWKGSLVSFRAIFLFLAAYYDWKWNCFKRIFYFYYVGAWNCIFQMKCRTESFEENANY